MWQNMTNGRHNFWIKLRDQKACNLVYQINIDIVVHLALMFKTDLENYWTVIMWADFLTVTAADTLLSSSERLFNATLLTESSWRFSYITVISDSSSWKTVAIFFLLMKVLVMLSYLMVLICGLIPLLCFVLTEQQSSCSSSFFSKFFLSQLNNVVILDTLTAAPAVTSADPCVPAR